MPARCVSVFCCAVAVGLALCFSGDSAAQTVWSGLTLSFNRPDGTDALLEENQDRITDNVWITRSEFGGGLVNAASECGGVFGCQYTHNFSPADTEWANAWLNPAETIEAANHTNLTFSDWEDAYDNRVGQLILNPLYSRAVVHLMSDDIYLDLRFTGWSQQCCGGFSYERAEEPGSIQPTGDYNGNGVVDAADFPVWRKTLNQPAVPAGSGADGDGDGTVDADDHAFWAARFGDIVPGGAGAVNAPAPEPATAMLLLTGVGMLPAITRKRRGARLSQ